MYKLFTDKSELFECDIKLEGASLSKSKARLVVETSDYSLLFKGEINSKGKCEIPIRKLRGLIDESTTGNIRLEVIAEDTFFIPWESDFEVDASKKVTVEVKSQTTKKPIVETKVNVKVKNKKPTITEKQHIANLFKLLIKEDINIDNISYKRNALNNIVATYLQENSVKNTGKIINGVLKVMDSYPLSSLENKK
jgi:hypothetical protein